MSWDVDIVIDTGGESPAVIEFVRNVTYNNGRIFHFLGIHPEDNHAMNCREQIPILLKAHNKLYEDQFLEKMKELEPENKWGGIEDVKDFVSKLLAACKRHPKAKVKWS